MASYGVFRWKTAFLTLLAVFLSRANGADIFLEWVVDVDTTSNPFTTSQPVSNEVMHLLHFLSLNNVYASLLKVCKNIVRLQVITINGMFPGPLINATTNDVVRVNVFNNVDEPLLITWYIISSLCTSLRYFFANVH